MDIELALMRMGLTSQTQNIVVQLNGAQSQKLGGQLQTDVGLIYGFNIYADTVDPSGNPLISTTDAMNLYLNLKIGAQNRIEVIRLDDLLNVYAGSPLIRTSKYIPLIIPWQDISLDKSTIENPTEIGFEESPAPEVWINMYYINMDDYQELIKRGPEFGIATLPTALPYVLDVAANATDAANAPPQIVNDNAKVIPAVAGRRKPA